MAALEADVAELRRRIGDKHEPAVLMRFVVCGELGEVVASACRPPLRELELQPAHEPPTLDGVDGSDLVLAPKNLVLPDHGPVNGAGRVFPAVGEVQRVELAMQSIG